MTLTALAGDRIAVSCAAATSAEQCGSTPLEHLLKQGRKWHLTAQADATGGCIFWVKRDHFSCRYTLQTGFLKSKIIKKNPNPNQSATEEKIPVGPWLHLWVSIDQQHWLQHRHGAYAASLSTK